MTIIPENVDLLTDTSRLVPGTPLHHGARNAVTFVELTPAGKIVARNDLTASSKVEAPPGEFGISRDVAARLLQPKAAEEFGPRLAALVDVLDREVAAREAMGAASIARQRLTSSDQTPPENRVDKVPTGFVPLQDGYTVPRGTPVIVRDSLRWRAGTSVFESPKGRIEVRWDSRFGGTDDRVARENAFIPKELEEELRTGKPANASASYRLILKSGSSGQSSTLANLLRNDLKIDQVIANSHARTTEPVLLKEHVHRAEALTLQARIAVAGGNAVIEKESEQ
jgi:hypothetical protein